MAFLATCVLALALPPTYRSTGTILIEQQEVPTDLVRSTVTSYADQRVQIISQRVMTTQNLLGIIQRYELYQSLQKRESREKVIERMRDDIRFRMISADVVDPRTGVPRQATIAFSVSYDNPSPDLAVKVANEITTLYLNENLTSRNRLAEDASSFLTQEGDRLSTQIAELEGKLADVQGKEHHASCPSWCSSTCSCSIAPSSSCATRRPSSARSRSRRSTSKRSSRSSSRIRSCSPIPASAS